MARRRPSEGARAGEAEPVEEGQTEIDELIRKAQETGTTGRVIMGIQPRGATAALRTLRDKVGIAMVSTAEAGAAGLTESDVGEGGILFHHLGIAIAPMEPDQSRAMAAASADSGISLSRPERLIYAISGLPGGVPPISGGPPPLVPPGTVPTIPVPVSPAVPLYGLSMEYLLGYRDALNHLVDGLLGMSGMPGVPTTIGTAASGVAQPQTFADTLEATWGLQAIRVFAPPFMSKFSGRGVKVAILDTGIDLTHPDFQGRVAASRSFVGQAVQDNHGHGTWCAGAVGGPQNPNSGRRYGVAYNADLYIGKVLQNNGFAIEGSLLNGINWAIEQGCRIVSMSLAVQTPSGMPDPIYEQVGEVAMDNNTALIAAAGNDSKRSQGIIMPVASPANSTKIMAVGAVDNRMRIADFSNGSGPGMAGVVDLVGPGVATYGAWSQTAIPKPNLPPGLHATISGTSMATPHVAGVAALIAEARPNYTAASILNALLLVAVPLSLSSRDAGKGLVQAPAND
jgi:subtilisin